MKEIEIGDKVAFSVQFLKNTGQITGNIPFARGVVTELKEISKGGCVLATVDWNDPDVSPKVNVKNLAIVGLNDRFMAM